MAQWLEHSLRSR